ncbi:MAG: transporter substrate-binding domain-containing protein [Pigmentiphaga sp.]|nr:transporter substrate-binding domain-containing protein [Pigmentiphaga sp.]
MHSKLVKALRRHFGGTLAGILATAAVGFTGTALANPAPLYAELPAAVQKAGEISVVADIMAPYRIMGEDGRTLIGLEADLIKALEPLLGVPLTTTIVANGPAVFTGIDTGRYDISFGPALATAEREKRYDMIPWLLSEPAFVLPVRHGLKTEKLTDLCGKRISVMSGSAAIREVEALDKRCAETGLKSVEQVLMPDQNSTLLAAQSGRSDAFSMQLAAALHLLKTRPDEFWVQTDDAKQLTVLNLGMILRHDSPLSPVMAKAMQTLMDNGEYGRILEQYGLRQAAVPAIRLNIHSQPR